MGKRGELEIEAIRLYADGDEIPAISAKLDVSENSLRAWKKRAGKEWDTARRVARADSIVAIEDVGSRLRRSREIAAQLTKDATGQGGMGRVLNQTVQTLLYDLMDKIDTAGIDPGEMTKLIADFSLIVGRTEQSATINMKREAEIRKQALAEAEKKAAAAIDKASGSTGATFTADDMRRIIRESYGV